MKRRITSLFLTLSFLICTTFTIAQDSPASDPIPTDSTGIQRQMAYLAQAEEQYENYSFNPAIDVYEVVYNEGYRSADLLKKLGDSYFFNAQYDKAYSYYLELVENYEEEVGPNYYYRMAQTSRSVGEYDHSEQMMEKYRELSRLDAQEDPYFSLANQLERIRENSGRYKFKFFPFNSNYSDFAPSFNKGELIFTSDRDTGNFARYRHTWNGMDFLDLYRVEKKGDSLKFQGKFSAQLNSRLHESTTAFSADGRTVYFSRNSFEKGRPRKDEAGFIRLRVYRSEQTEDGTWGPAEDLSINSPDYSVAHPALSPDGRQLYFVSDMPGGYGSTDLFVVDINEDGSLGAPKNLGPYINTRGRETFPFVSVDSVLYFSSDGHFSLGGLDVFATRIKPAYDQPIRNVGRPVNTRYDDFGLIINSARDGYFATNRPGDPLTADKMQEWAKPKPNNKALSEDDNIIAFHEIRALEFDCRVAGQVRDRISRKPLEGVLVQIVNDRNELIDTVRTDANGLYNAELYCNRGNFVRGSLENYVPDEQFLPTPREALTKVDLFLERGIVVLPMENPDNPADIAKLLALNTIYFDLNKYNIRPDAEVEIQKVIALLRKFPRLKIRVVSHTDSRGRASYNQWLSQKRAESTVEYMISQGIDQDRLISEGKGEENIINECVDGVSCSAAKHQENRRSEFLIYE